MDNTIIKKIISYAILASVFITGGLVDIGFRVEWYHLIYAPFAVVCLLGYHRFSLKIAIILIALTAFSLMTYNDSQMLVWKQLINISFSAFVFYNFLIWEDWDYEEIFKKYLTLAKIVLVIGFFQVAVFAIQPYGGLLQEAFFSLFPYLKETNITLRYQSVTQEPSYIAYTFAPVVFLAFYNLTRRSYFLINRSWSILFVLAYVLTFSLIAYIGIIVILMILYFKNFTNQKLAGVLVVFLLLGALAGVMYSTVSEVKMRTDDTLYGFGKDITKRKVYHSVNLTTYSLLTNLYVTKKNLSEHPATGTGLGTYQISYDRNMPDDMKNYYIVNREDAGSMAFRILSETGIIGLGVFIFFLLHFRIRSHFWFSDRQEFLWLMNAGIFVMIFLFLIRSGNYTYQGRVLFMMLYYYTYTAAKNE